MNGQMTIFLVALNYVFYSIKRGSSLVITNKWILKRLLFFFLEFLLRTDGEFISDSGLFFMFCMSFPLNEICLLNSRGFWLSPKFISCCQRSFVASVSFPEFSSNYFDPFFCQYEPPRPSMSGGHDCIQDIFGVIHDLIYNSW